MENGVDIVVKSDSGVEILHKNGILELSNHAKTDLEAEEVFEEAVDGILEETDPAPPLRLAEAQVSDGEDEVGEDFQDAPASERSVCDGAGVEQYEEAVQPPVEEAIAPAGGGEVDGDKSSDLSLRCRMENGNGTVTLHEHDGLERNGVIELADGLVVESPGQIVDEDFRNSTVKEQEEGIGDVVECFEKEHLGEMDPVEPENGDCSVVEANEVCLQPEMLANGQASHDSGMQEKSSSSDISVVEQLKADIAVEQFIDLENSQAELSGSDDLKPNQVTEGTAVSSSEEIPKQRNDESNRLSGLHSSADTSSLPKRESYSADGYGKLVSSDKDETEATVGPTGDAYAVDYGKVGSENYSADESHAIHSRSETVNDETIHGVIEEIPEEKVEGVSSLHEMVKILPGETIQKLEVGTNVDEGLKADDATAEQLRDEEPETRVPAISPEAQSKQVLVADNVDIGKTEELADEKIEEKSQSNIIHNSTTINDSPGRESVHVAEYEDSVSTDDDVAASTITPPPGDKCSTTRSSIGIPPPSRPAGLGSSAPLLEPAHRVPLQSRVNGTAQERHSQHVEEAINGETDEYDETREKLQMIRVKFLRLAHRLGQTPHNTVVAQVLYRLGLAEQLRGSRMTSRAGAFSFDRASAMAEQLEAAGQEPLDFSCTILVLGKTGVGKSATINSIFDEVKFNTDAFELGTMKVQDIVGTVQGIKVRVIDTPGLLTSCLDQHRNEKILNSVKSFIKKNPPDIVLYLDRLDMQSRDYGDVPLLRTITNIFGHSIWFNAIVVLTHAASAPPDGPNGVPMSYEMFVTQRSHVVQQAIRQAAGDVRLMNPVSLVENHSACRTNRAGQRVLPNGQVWKPQLLLLSFASKILAEANTLLKLQDNPPGKPFSGRPRVPPLPFLLSSLLQSRPHLKLPEEQYDDDDDNMEEDMDDTSDSDNESEYDELPPFKRLTKAQLANLSKAQKKAYFEELEYREKLFMKKQLKEEKKRRKLLKKMADAAKDLPNDYNENAEEEIGGPSSVPVSMPDLALPTSFDADNPTYRYRCLDSNQWLVRPVLESHGWDHDVGYEGLNVERLFVVKDKIPVSFSGQVTKDKKDCNLQMEVASSVKHGEKKATSFGFDMQTLGKELMYTLRSETCLCNFRRNTASAGLSVTSLGDSFTAGMKIEDRMMVHKRFRLVMTGGAMTSRGDVAYGGSLEATLRDKDYPLGRTLSTLGLSIMDWHGDLAIGGNAQSQFPVGRSSNLIARASLNNKGSGQLSIRLNSSEQLQIAFIALVPVIRNIIKTKFLDNSS